jgi:hypothetical protein
MRRKATKRIIELRSEDVADGVEGLIGKSSLVSHRGSNEERLR